MQRRHSENIGSFPTVAALMSVIKAKNIPVETATLSGWDDGSVGVHWWAEETHAETRDRVRREAQAAYNRERSGRD